MELVVDRVFERSGGWYAIIRDTENSLVYITIEGDKSQDATGAAEELCRKVNTPLPSERLALAAQGLLDALKVMYAQLWTGKELLTKEDYAALGMARDAIKKAEDPNTPLG